MKLQMLAALLIVFLNPGTELRTTKTIEEFVRTNLAKGSSAAIATRDSKPNHIFHKIVPILLQKTRVPLRLPAYVPDSDDAETPLYAIVEVASPDAYSIQLAWLEDCNGGNACHVGYVGGTKTRPQPSDKHEVPVTLSGGIKGSFVDSDCGAHCDDASVYWTEGSYYYGISLKGGAKKTLLLMANSAIHASVAEQSHQ